jgi:MerR family transcriptional regulator, light-induced transcriptional regulator
MDLKPQNPIPIREISRLTGVNSVTLRAWERRYGLIKPLRTNKGHRLYRREDVELIKTIQAWLARGLAIGKVSELLESGQPVKELDIENIWQAYLSELLAIMAALHLGKLDAFFNQLFSVYPAALVADQLITPALENLEQDVFGNSVKKAILVNHLAEYVAMLTQRQRQQAKGKRIAILQLTSATNPLLNVLLHYGLIMNQVRSELIGLVSAAEVVFAAEQLRLDALMVYNDSCTSLSEFQKELLRLAQTTSLPIIVGGKLVHALTLELPPQIFLAHEAGQQAMADMINNLFPDVLAEVLTEAGGESDEA